MSVRTTRLGAVVALAVVALLGTWCGAGPPPGSAPPSAAGDAPAVVSGEPPAGRAALPSSAGVPAPGAPTDQVGQAHQAALGLVALGGLGAQKGTTDALRALADTVTAEGRAMDQQVRALATGQDLALSDDLGAQVQGVVNDLQSRSGTPFDQAWLRAVGDLVAQGRDAADAVLSSPSASDEAKAAARDALTRLDALGAAVRDATNAAGAATPSAADAGTGGPAAPVLPAALVGLGALLLATAVVLRRRRA